MATHRKRSVTGRFVARKRAKASAAPKRRRRRTASAHSRTTPVVKRRYAGRKVRHRVRVYRTNPPTRRRRARRNPPGLINVRSIFAGVKDGAIIAAGQWGTARISEQVVKVIPASITAKLGNVQTVGVANLISAITASIVARKVSPQNARLIAAAAWAQAITSTVGATTAGAELLSGNLSALTSKVAVPPTGAVAGYSGARRLAGYAASGYNVSAGRGSQVAGYAGGSDNSVGFGRGF